MARGGDATSEQTYRGSRERKERERKTKRKRKKEFCIKRGTINIKGEAKKDTEAGDSSLAK